MRDTDLHQRIFGLEKPWFVKRVDLQVVEHRVDIWLEHPPGAKWPCPNIQATIKCVPDAGGKIVFDRFHTMNRMVKAVDKVWGSNLHASKSTSMVSSALSRRNGHLALTQIEAGQDLGSTGHRICLLGFF